MAAALYDILFFPILMVNLAAGAIGFSDAAFLRAAAQPEAQLAALTIAFLAGVSEMLGQSVVLVVNRVALYRFIASLLFTGASYVLTVLTWGLSALFIAPLTPAGAFALTEISAVFGVLSLAFAPRLFGVFSIAPYFGAALGNALEVWAMGLAIFGLSAGLNLPIGAAIFCAGAGWTASFLFRSFLGHALAAPLGRLRLFISGSPLERSPQQLVDEVVDRLRGDAKP